MVTSAISAKRKVEGAVSFHFGIRRISLGVLMRGNSRFLRVNVGGLYYVLILLLRFMRFNGANANVKFKASLTTCIL